MKIAIIVPSLANYGPVIVANDLTKEYVKMGHDCTVYYFDIKETPLIWTCLTKKLSESQKFNFQDFDVIHSHGFRPDRYVKRFRKSMKAAGCTLISTQHNAIDFRSLCLSYSIAKAFVGSILWKKCLSAFDKIVFLNEFTHSQFSKKIYRKGCVIFNGRDLNFSTDKIVDADKKIIEALRSQYILVGTCCRFIKRKGVEQIIKALPQLEKVAFLGIGDGKEVDNLNQLAANLGVKDRVRLIGYRRNCVNYLPMLDLFIMTSRSEGFPLALVEAAAAGLPTVLSDIKIFKAIIPNNTIQFYHIDDINDLVKAVNMAIKDKDRLSKAIRKYYDTNLTSSKMAHNYIRLYRDCLK